MSYFLGESIKFYFLEILQVGNNLLSLLPLIAFSMLANKVFANVLTLWNYRFEDSEFFIVSFVLLDFAFYYESQFSKICLNLSNFYI